MNTVVPIVSVIRSPYGTAATSTSRDSTRASRITIGSLRAGGRAAVERGLHRVPGERGALHAHRELVHALEHGELAELGRDLGSAARVGRHELVETLEQELRLVECLARERVG